MTLQFTGLNEPGLLHLAIAAIERYKTLPLDDSPSVQCIAAIKRAKGKMSMRDAAKKYNVTVNQIRYYQRNQEGT
jgi:hypothetical protein